MAKVNKKREMNTNWLSPATILPDKVDVDAGQPELINPTSNIDAHGLDPLGFLPGSHRPQLKFAVRSQSNAGIGKPEKTSD